MESERGDVLSVRTVMRNFLALFTIMTFLLSPIQVGGAQISAQDVLDDSFEFSNISEVLESGSASSDFETKGAGQESLFSNSLADSPNPFLIWTGESTSCGIYNNQTACENHSVDMGCYWDDAGDGDCLVNCSFYDGNETGCNISAPPCEWNATGSTCYFVGGFIGFLNVSMTKDAVNASYNGDESIQFVINVTNNGDEDIMGIIIDDNYNSSLINFTNASCPVIYWNDTAGEIEINVTACNGNLTSNESLIVYLNFTGYAGNDSFNTTNYALVNITDGNGFVTAEDFADVEIIMSPAPMLNLNVSLMAPSDGIEIPGSPMFQYNVTKNGGSENVDVNCSLYIGDVFNASDVNNTFSLNESNPTHLGSWNSDLVAEGTYNWSVECIDISNPEIPYESGIFYFNITAGGEDGLLNISVEKYSLNESYVDGETIEFVVNITNNGEENITGIVLQDDYNASRLNFTNASCPVISFNGTSGLVNLNVTACAGNLSVNQSFLAYLNFTNIGGGPAFNTTNNVMVNVTEGYEFVSVEDSTVVEVTFDGYMEPVEVHLVSPENNNNSLEGEVSFKYNVTVLSEAADWGMNCSLMLNGSLNATDSSNPFNITNETAPFESEINATLGTGSYNWTILCEEDTAGEGFEAWAVEDWIININTSEENSSCTDADGDGFNVSGTFECGPADCNDNNNTIYPGASESGACSDNVDNDCDWLIDEFDGDCSPDAMPDWDILNYMKPPYSANGPGCYGAGMPSNPEALPGSGNCPESKVTYDLGAVWVDQDSEFVYWRLMASNLSNSKMCGGEDNFRLFVEFDVDDNMSTGCQNCFMGADYQFIVNLDGYGEMWIFNDTKCPHIEPYDNNYSGTYCFSYDPDIPVYVNRTMNGSECAAFPSEMKVAVKKSTIANITGMGFEVNSFDHRNAGDPTGSGPYDQLRGGDDMDRFGGLQDKVEGMECFRFDDDADQCNNDTDEYNCHYNSQFQVCEPDFQSFQDCDSACFACGNSSACNESQLGFCDWTSTPQGDMCVEQFNPFEFGGGDCDDSCDFCFSEGQCENSIANGAASGYGGCDWLTDPFNGKGFCEVSGFQVPSCTNVSADGQDDWEGCIGQVQCEGKGWYWDVNNTLCKSNASSEICFDQIDNDGDNYTDCQDSDCYTHMVCGGGIDTLTGEFAGRDPFDAMQDFMFQGMDNSPPVILGQDDTGETIGWGDITQIGVKDGEKSIFFGMALDNMSIWNATESTSCSYMGDGDFKSMFFIDTDDNESSGCNVTINEQEYAGYEFILRNSAGNADHMFVSSLKCAAGSWLMNPVRVSPKEDLACSPEPTIALLVQKADIGNPRNTVRFRAATVNTSWSNLSNIDAYDTFEAYYTPGSVDFEPVDCFQNPGRCGAAFGLVGEGKFMPFEDCMMPGDEDLDGLENCADPDCDFLPQCQGTYNASGDNDAPRVSMSSVDVFDLAAFVMWSTNEPTNGSLLFYEQDGSCTTINTTLNEHTPPDAPADAPEFKPWHGALIDIFETGYDLEANTTYYYKIKNVDRADNPSQSKCLNFTTRSAPRNITLIFNFTNTNNTYVDNMSARVNNNNITLGAPQTFNMTRGTNLSFRGDFPDKPGNYWEITFVNADIVKAASLDLSTNMLANASGDSFVLGMKSGLWLEMAQKMGCDYILLRLPILAENLEKCSDDGTSCEPITDEVVLQASGGTPPNDYSIWKIPVAFGFSTYGISESVGDVNFTVSKTVLNDSVLEGDTLQYIINVTNTDSRNFTVIAINDSFDTALGVEFWASDSFNSSGNGWYYWTDVTGTGVLQPGNSYLLYVNLSADQSGNNLFNNATVNVTADDGNTSVTTAYVAVNVTGSSDNLSVIKQDIPELSNYTVGGLVSFRINVTNNEEYNVSTAFLFDNFNGSMLNYTNQSSCVNAPTDWANDESGYVNINLTECLDITELENGTTYSIILNFTPIMGGNTSNTATVAECSECSSIDSWSVDLNITGTIGGGDDFSVMVSKQIMSGGINVGDNITFLVNVTNNGVQPLYEAWLLDTFNVDYNFTNSTNCDVYNYSNELGNRFVSINLSTCGGCDIPLNGSEYCEAYLEFFATTSAESTFNAVNISAYNMTGAETNDNTTIIFGIGAGSSGNDWDEGLDEWQSSVVSPYVMQGESKVLNFSLYRRAGDSSCLSNLTIVVPGNFTFEGYNASSIDSSNYTFVANANYLTWIATADDFFCGQDSQNFLFNVTADSDYLGSDSFYVQAETSGDDSNLSLSVWLTTPFSYNGTVMAANDGPLSGVVASITATVMDMTSDATLGTFTATTDENGTFIIADVPATQNVSNISGGMEMGPPEMGAPTYQLTVTKYNDSGNNFGMFVGPTLPQLGVTGLLTMLDDPTIYLKPAVTFHLSVEGYDYMSGPVNENETCPGPDCPGWEPEFNWTSVDFGYEIKDNRLGYSVASEYTQTAGSEGRYITAIGERNYTISLFPQSSFPLSVAFSDIENNCSEEGTNISTSGVVASCTITNGTYLVDAVISSQSNNTPLTGYFNMTNLSSMRVVAYSIEGENRVFESWAMPFNLGNMENFGNANDSLNDQYNLTTGEYTIYLPATMTASQIMLRAYAEKDDAFYGSSHIISASDLELSQDELNFSINPLVQGTSRNVSSENVADNWNTTVVANTTAVLFNLVSGGAVLTSENSFIEVERELDGFEYMQMTDATSGQFTMTLEYGESVEDLTIYSQQYAPLKTSISSGVLSGGSNSDVTCAGGICNITMRQFSPFDPDNPEASMNVMMRMFKSNTTCDVPNPPAGCSMNGGSNKSEFSPLKAILMGDVSLRITTGNLSVHYAGTDLLASGPPDAAFSQNFSGNSMSAAWKFGSSGPEIYSEVLISMPFDESLENSTLNVSIPLLYDNDFNVAWNASENNISDLEGGAYADFLNNSYEAYLNGTGVICSETDENLTEGQCYKDVESLLIWMKIPHFSGVGPEVVGVSEDLGGSEFVVHLIGPPNASWFDHRSHSFNCNISDNESVANLTLYVWNQTGSLIRNETDNVSGVYNQSSFSYELPYDGTFEWNCLGYDTVGNSNWSVEGNYTINIDAVTPDIDFEEITTDNGSFNQSYIVANVTSADENLDEFNMTLYNSVGGIVSSSISSATPFFVNFTGLSSGVYYLNATVNDSAGNENWTETRMITLDVTSYQDIDSCPGEVSGNGINYRLTESFLNDSQWQGNKGWTCFNFNESDDNVVVDCQGYSIVGNLSSNTQIFYIGSGADNITIKNCVLMNVSQAILAADSSSHNITNNTFELFTDASGDGDGAVEFDNVSGSYFTDNSIDMDFPSIQNALSVHGSNANFIERNTFSNIDQENKAAIWLGWSGEASDGNVVRDNFFNSASHSIRLENASNSVVTGNWFDNTYLNLTDNQVTINSASSGNSIYGNNFTQNQSVDDDGVGNSWNSSSTGNDWLQYNDAFEGCMNNGDGFCELPYRLNGDSPSAYDFLPVYHAFNTSIIDAGEYDPVGDDNASDNAGTDYSTEITGASAEVSEIGGTDYFVTKLQLQNLSNSTYCAGDYAFVYELFIDSVSEEGCNDSEEGLLGADMLVILDVGEYGLTMSLEQWNDTLGVFVETGYTFTSQDIAIDCELGSIEVAIPFGFLSIEDEISIYLQYVTNDGDVEYYDYLPSSTSGQQYNLTDASISVTKTALNGPINQSETAMFLLFLNNTGGENLSEVIVYDSYNDSELVYESSSCDVDNSTSGLLVINVTDCYGVLAVGESTNVYVNFTAMAEEDTTVTNFVQVNATDVNDYLVSSSDSTTIYVQVRPITNVSLVKTVLDSNVTPGELANFTINITNNGNYTISNLNLTDDFTSAFFDYASASPTPDSISDGVIIWNDSLPASLSVGSSYLVNLSLRVMSAGNSTNYANITIDSPWSAEYNASSSVSIVAPGDAYEYDGNYLNATPMATDGTQQRHSLYPSGDYDWFAVNLTSGKEYVFLTSNLSTPIDDSDTEIFIYSPSLVFVDSNDDIASGVVRNSRIVWVANETGTFYFGVHHWDDSSVLAGYYNVSVTERIVDALDVSVVEPSDNHSVYRYDTFNFTINLTCNADSCSNITTYLDPKSASEQVASYAIPQTASLDLRSVAEELPEDELLDVIIVLEDEEQSSSNPKGGRELFRTQSVLALESRRSSVSERQKAVLAKLSEPVKNGLLGAMSSPKFDLKRKFEVVNAMSGRISKAGLEALKDDPRVKSVQVDREVHAFLDVSVPQINADDVWAMQAGSSNVTGLGQTVCVVDTGINYSHPDFGSCDLTSDINDGSCPKVIGGYDFVNSDSDPSDDQSINGSGHGSHCAGIIASEDSTYRGVAPGAKLVAVKSLNNAGVGSTGNVIAGVDWCINNADALNITVISMSLGGGGPYDSNCDSDALAEAINYATDQGISVVVAAGNDGFDNGVSSPACASGAIAVGAVDSGDAVASYSNSGSLVDIFAPGSGIIATDYAGTHTTKSGTSMATPHVAGAIALMQQYYEDGENITLRPEAIEARLKSVGPLVTDSGAGITRPRLDIEAALSKGIIPMNSGSPFFTTTQNPNVTSLVQGESVLLTWVVNTTGLPGTDWEFFTFSTLDESYEEYNSSMINVSITNRVPSVSSVDIVPSTAYTNTSQLYCNGTYADEDNQSESGSTFKWFNQSGLISGQTSQTLASSYFVKGDTIICEYTPNDGQDSGTPVNSSNLTISNLAPTFDFALEAQTVAENSTLLYDINCSDIDEDDGVDTITYYDNSSEWNISSAGLINWTPGFFDYGYYTYDVICGDGTINTTTILSINVTNTNVVPSVSDISYNMSSLYRTQSVDVRCSAEDLETSNSSLTINITYKRAGDGSWSDLSGETYDATNGWWVASLATSSADEWLGTTDFNCSVSDGTDSAELVENDQVTVLNNAPVLDLSVLDNMQLEEDTSNGTINISLYAGDVEDADSLLNHSCASDNENLTVSVSNSTKMFAITALNNWSGIVTVNCTSYDTDSGSDSSGFDVNVTPVNDAPSLSAVDVQNTSEDATTESDLSVYASDVDGDSTSLIVVSHNVSQVNCSASSMNLTMTPADDWYGTATCTVRVTDGTLNSSDVNVTINVSSVNDLPVIDLSSIDELYVIAEDLYNDTINLSLYVEDVEDDDSLITWVCWSNESYVSALASNTTKLLNVSASNDWYGYAEINCTGTDLNGGSSSDTFQVNISSVNDAPVTTSLDPIAIEEDSYNDTANLSDAVSDVDHADALINWSCFANESDISVVASNVTKFLNITASNDYYGLATINCTAYDPVGASDSFTFEINVTPVDAGVSVSKTIISGVQPAENVSIQFNVTITNTNRGTLQAVSLRDIYDASLLNFTGADYAPDQSMAGELNWSDITNNISDISEGSSISFLMNFTIISLPGATNNTIYVQAASSIGENASSSDYAIVAPSQPPVINSTPVTSATENALYTYDVNASDPENDTITYALQEWPTGMEINSTTGVITWTPDNSFSNPVQVNVTASDDYSTDVQNFSIIVTNIAGQINSSPITSATEDSLYSYNVDSTDEGEGSTFYTLLTYPTGMVINATSGLIAWTPDNADVLTTNTVNVSVNDTHGGVDTQQFVITVSNTAPSFNSSAITSAEEDSLYSYDVDCTDEGLNVTYSIVGGSPAWLSINATTGLLSGTPTNAHVGANAVNISANDSTDVVYHEFTITVNNTLPAFNSSDITSATEDSSYTYDLDTTDENVGTTSYTMRSDTDGMSFNTTTGVITWTPDNSQVGIETINVSFNDGTGDVYHVFNIAVSNVAPSFNSTDITTATEDSAYTYDIDCTDESVGAFYTLIGGVPAWLSVNLTTGVLSGTPTNAYVGVNSINVSANDTNGAVIFKEFTITVNNTNDAPELNTSNLVPNASWPEDTINSSINLSQHFFDVDTGASLTFTASSVDNITVSISGSLVNMTPDGNFTGVRNVTFTASDGTENASSNLVILNVTPVNDAPDLSAIPAQSTSEDTATEADLSAYASDVDGDSTSLIVVSHNVSAVNCSASSMNLTMTPADDWYGTATCTVRVTDGTLNSSDVSVTINVSSVNDAPSLDLSALDQAVVIAEDYYNDTINLSDYVSDVESADSAITWVCWSNESYISALASNTTKLVNISASNNFYGSGVINCTSTDADSGSASDTFQVNITSVNDAPVLTALPVQSLTEDTDAEVDLSSYVSDVENDSVSLIVISENVSQVNCTASGTNISMSPASNWYGVATCTIRATDSVANSSDRTLTMNVSAVNDAPSFTSSALTSATEDSIYSYDVNASDVDTSDTLTFALVTSISGMSINSSTGVVSWTPDNSQVGSNSVNISVTDGTAIVYQAFAIDVLNVAPTITSSAVTTATEDTAYLYDVNSSDDGQGNITYSLTTYPANMTINSSTGVLSWTPENFQVTLDNNVTVMVNDGNGANDTQSFSINVTNTNDVPVFNVTISNVSITEGGYDESINLLTAFYDSDSGDSLGFNVTEAENLTVSIVNATGAVNITPDSEFNGIRYLTFTAIDSSNETAVSNQVKVTVSGVNDAPVLTAIPDQVIAEEGISSVLLSDYASDVDGDSISYSILGENTSQVDCLISSANLSFTGATDFNGTANCTVIATDGLLNSSARTITINVTGVNDAPVASITTPGDGSTVVQSALVFQGTGTDVEDGSLSGDSLVWVSSIDGNFANGTSKSYAPSAMGVMEYYVSAIGLSVGNHTINLTATDSGNLSHTDSISLEVVASGSTNYAPSVAITAPDDGSSYENGTQVNFTATATDNEDGSLVNDSVVWESSLDGNFANGTVVNSSALSIGIHTITVTVTDSGNLTRTDSINITITAPADEDGDGVVDDFDTMIGDDDEITNDGASSISVEVNGSSSIDGNIFNESLTVAIKDGSDFIVNFTHNFSQSSLNMSKVTVHKNQSGVVIDLGGQLQQSKSIFLTDYDFGGLCVKDAPITSIGAISSTCTGANEYDLTLCIGNTTGYQNAHITCTDLGDSFRFDNLSHSGVVGTGGDFSTPVSPSGGGSGGGSSVSSNKIILSEDVIYELEVRRGSKIEVVYGAFAHKFNVYGVAGSYVKLLSSTMGTTEIYPAGYADFDFDADTKDETRITLVSTSGSRFTLHFELISDKTEAPKFEILPPREDVPKTEEVSESSTPTEEAAVVEPEVSVSEPKSNVESSEQVAEEDSGMTAKNVLVLVALLLLIAVLGLLFFFYRKNQHMRKKAEAFRN